MYGESNMGTYIIICKTDSQREFAVWLRKLKKEFCINLGEGDGREVQEGGDICKKKKKKKGLCWTSQVVQWLRLYASTEEGMGLIPGQGT